MIREMVVHIFPPDQLLLVMDNTAELDGKFTDPRSIKLAGGGFSSKRRRNRPPRSPEQPHEVGR